DATLPSVAATPRQSNGRSVRSGPSARRSRLLAPTGSLDCPVFWLLRRAGISVMSSDTLRTAFSCNSVSLTAVTGEGASKDDILVPVTTISLGTAVSSALASTGALCANACEEQAIATVEAAHTNADFVNFIILP